MPTYFFNFDGEGGNVVSGEWDGPADAQREAIVRAGEIMCEPADAFLNERPWGMTVTSSAARPVFLLSIVADAPTGLPQSSEADRGAAR